ncbi:aminotransferase class I/II-fold pyridoxal phosphate-dependent enzyme [Hydrogenovibrio thermophilus]|uniref:Aminotransferase class I/II-fold pyridoxal phosphate-dependent enzyme n=1 Tax=Hydrogenovibrio thermophilus TaxID=265883 RepID=A0A410H593_9GAMM|nr:aminotransferase class I/II-fold pyridoxal phosphate-dependent enzyme [Hydrogenovibrio thermophilus]QAB16067.1 aminotransferase class I/II-fold pyridoxal phosphate-dependent enzyme [Hydrogenovibrio thermophilus]
MKSSSSEPYPIADTARQIQPFHVMKILGEAKALEAQGRDIIHMEIGEPDFSSLPQVHDAVQQAMNAEQTHYTPTLGLPELRTALSDFYQNFYGAEVPSERIMLTPGSSSGLQLLLTALLNPKDKVLMPDPAYPCNREFVRLLQGQLISVPVTESTRYQLTLSSLKSHWQDGIKVVMVASPSNPTGTVIEADELVAMAEFAAQKGAYLLVDEIYQGLVYDRPAESILSRCAHLENVLVINSFSKFFCMTGWRLGWLVAPDFLIPTLERLGQNLFLSAPTLSQYGALAVLKPDALAELERRRQTFQQRRDALMDAMQSAGFAPRLCPDGAFYLYWDISAFSDDAEAFCLELLHETGVALTPGTDFGDYRAKQHVRLAYTNDEATLLRAVDKLKGALLKRAPLSDTPN